MALADYTPERVTISHRGRPLVEIRGLCLDDVSILVRAHSQTIQKLYETTQANGPTSDGMLGVGETFFLDVMTVAPDVLFDVIALAADEAEYGSEARKLPMAVQINILQEIMRLTFEDMGGPKAFVGLVVKLIGQRKQLPAGKMATTL